ncbi:MAG: imidazolonepropionase-like amidohydrolase [Candidatus Azotimanducaceae bacterium]|jgi:imidazolonepropionase-like amidohydrolase
MAHLFKNLQLFNGTSDEIIANSIILTENGTITYAGSTAESPQIPANAEITDLDNQFVMPGMVETHAHLSFSDASPFAIGQTPVESATITAVKNAQKMVNAGFTSAVSFGSTYAIDVALRDAINSGQIVGPRLMAAGRDLGATASNVDSNSGLSQIADGPWALRQAVRQQRKQRVDVVKIFIDGEAINPTCPPGELSFTNEEVNAIVDEAHRRNLKVACHARSAAAVKQAVLANVDFIGHANYLDNEAIDLLAAKRDSIFVGPAIAWEVQYLAQCESLGIPKATAIKQGYEAEIEATIESVAKMRAAEIKLVVGGDYGISIAPHGTYAKDLEYFVELFGMSEIEAIHCATRNGGEMMSAYRGLGTLVAGAPADFVAVSENPLSDITVLQHHDNLTVFKAGNKVSE